MNYLSYLFLGSAIVSLCACQKPVNENIMEPKYSFQWNEQTQTGLCMDSEGVEGYNPRFVGPCGDLRGYQFQSVFLDGVDLRGAILDGMNLQKFSLNGTNLLGVKARGVNFSGARLNGANLSFGQFEGSNFEKAQMNGANLSQAQLSGALLSHSPCMGRISLNRMLVAPSSQEISTPLSSRMRSSPLEPSCPLTRKSLWHEG